MTQLRRRHLTTAAVAVASRWLTRRAELVEAAAHSPALSRSAQSALRVCCPSRCLTSASDHELAVERTAAQRPRGSAHHKPRITVSPRDHHHQRGRPGLWQCASIPALNGPRELTRERQVEVCSTVAGQRQCIRISQDVTKVFALMQSIGTHFCTLPQDPAHTEIECQPLSRLMR